MAETVASVLAAVEKVLPHLLPRAHRPAEVSSALAAVEKVLQQV